MIPKSPICECGAALRFEARQRIRGAASLATCSNPGCGRISFDGSPEGGLRACLLGDAPVVRDLKPWNRLFFKSVTWGYRWTSHFEGCRYCSHELTVELRLPPRSDRRGDPSEIVCCLNCGSTTTRFWIDGESVLHTMEGSAWNEPHPAIQAVKRALAVRVSQPQEPYTWDFW